MNTELILFDCKCDMLAAFVESIVLYGKDSRLIEYFEVSHTIIQ